MATKKLNRHYAFVDLLLTVGSKTKKTKGYISHFGISKIFDKKTGEDKFGDLIGKKVVVKVFFQKFNGVFNLESTKNSSFYNIKFSNLSLTQKNKLKEIIIKYNKQPPWKRKEARLSTAQDIDCDVPTFALLNNRSCAANIINFTLGGFLLETTDKDLVSYFALDKKIEFSVFVSNGEEFPSIKGKIVRITQEKINNQLEFVFRVGIEVLEMPPHSLSVYCDLIAKYCKVLKSKGLIVKDSIVL